LSMSMFVNRKGFEVGKLFSLETVLSINIKKTITSKATEIVKSEKYEKFCVSKLLIWRRKSVAPSASGDSLFTRRVSPGSILVVLF